MARVGRNDPCPCGSGRKAKHCCGVPRGPSKEELAKAFVSTEGRKAVADIGAPPDDDEWHELYEEMVRLPRRHLSLLLPLPKLFSPELHELASTLRREDDEAAREALNRALPPFNTFAMRAHLARAIIALREQRTIDETIAAVALNDLASGSESLLRASLLAAVGVYSGELETPSGIVIARH